MVAAGQDVADIAPHFETRSGKRKWLERTKRARRAESPWVLDVINDTEQLPVRPSAWTTLGRSR